MIGALAACWGGSYALSTVSVTPRYWFFFPIMLAAARFGRRGALIAAVAAGLLAVTLPSTVALPHGQELSSSLSRGVFFIVMGQALAGVFAVALGDARRQRNTLKAAKALAVALHRGDFVVWYQPIVELESRAVVGAEALVRWNHPTKGLIAPSEFIGTAEVSGMIIPLGAHVLETACRQLELWRQSTLANVESFILAVNISAYELSTPDLLTQLQGLLDETGIPPSWLHLEITETAVIVDLEAAAIKVAEIRALGVRIAIDDFGIGHTSLKHLQRLAVDVIKIDQSFVAALEHGGRRDMAGAVIALAEALGMQTVAEGAKPPAKPRNSKNSEPTSPRVTSTVARNRHPRSRHCSPTAKPQAGVPRRKPTNSQKTDSHRSKTALSRCQVSECAVHGRVASDPKDAEERRDGPLGPIVWGREARQPHRPSARQSSQPLSVDRYSRGLMNRHRVAQAAGMVSVQAGCTPEEALAMMTTRATETGHTVEEIATAVVKRLLRFD